VYTWAYILIKRGLIVKNKKIKSISTAAILATASMFAINMPFNSAIAHDTSKASKTAVSKKSANKIDESVTKLVDKVTQGRAKITGSFKAIGDLNGYIIAPKEGPQQEMIAFVPKDSKYIVFGNIISADGTNLSEQYKQKYIMSKQAIKVYKKIHTMKYISVGPDSAKHKLYALIDTDCSYCNLLYKELKVYTEGKDAQLQIRFIPVSIRGAGSRMRAAEIVSAQLSKGNAAAAKLLDQDESKFDESHESGGLKGIEDTSSNKKYFDIVDQNTKFFTDSGFSGTPVLLYIDKKTGMPAVIPGYIPKPAQLATIDKMSDSWVSHPKKAKK
jgi:thiol:disulfide interchange protein DsbG